MPSTGPLYEKGGGGILCVLRSTGIGSGDGNPLKNKKLGYKNGSLFIIRSCFPARQGGILFSSQSEGVFHYGKIL